jgi:hypothetical protein
MGYDSLEFGHDVGNCGSPGLVLFWKEELSGAEKGKGP